MFIHDSKQDFSRYLECLLDSVKYECGRREMSFGLLSARVAGCRLNFVQSNFVNWGKHRINLVKIMRIEVSVITSLMALIGGN